MGKSYRKPYASMQSYRAPVSKRTMSLYLNSCDQLREEGYSTARQAKWHHMVTTWDDLHVSTKSRKKPLAKVAVEALYEWQYTMRRFGADKGTYRLVRSFCGWALTARRDVLLVPDYAPFASKAELAACSLDRLFETYHIRSTTRQAPSGWLWIGGDTVDMRDLV